MTSPALHVRGRIIAGPEEVHDQLWVVDGQIRFEAPDRRDVEQIDGWVLPGLVDAHCHIGLEATGGVGPERAEQHARTDRAAGTLLVRDAGSPVDTSWIHDRPDLPRLIRAGRHIARTRRYIPGFAHEVEPDQLVGYVRQEARAGDGWVKLVGDWIDRKVGDLGTCWPLDVLSEAVAVAHAEGAKVTAHCFAEQSLHDFVEAGTDCVEHATGLQDDTIQIFAERQIAIVPTLVNIENFPDFAAAGEAKFPAYAAHMRDLYARRFETVAKAHEAGVPIYTGTDAGGLVPHGLIAREVQALARAGLSPIEAIGAATWGPRAWLGQEGIVEGASADMVVYAEDPREDLGVLNDPRHIILRGVIV